ncbi:hypothetical protein [Niabella hirudinis]|uniref:hypothetical protein n=1 Tax=Niabella hirudinis TaxID=1285929 RepID=UPI003EC0288A
MQRIEALIEKLRTQFNNKADLSQLLITTQMIQREISGEMKETAVLGSSSVAVVMPNMPSMNKGVIVKDRQGGDREYFQLDAIGEDEADEEELRLLELQHEAGLYAPDPESMPSKNTDRPDKYIKINGFDPLLEVPTLFQQVQDRNQSVAVPKKEMLPPVPKSPMEMVTDLTMDISDADKERFVKNLFRGDAVMYNRSVKTINNFDTLEEAEYWVKRELKTKLGWANSRDVEYFDRLIYRRFSRI